MIKQHTIDKIIEFFYTKSLEKLILTANCNQNVDGNMNHLFCVNVIKV